MREEQTQSVFKKEGAEEALRQKIKKTNSWPEKIAC